MDTATPTNEAEVRGIINRIAGPAQVSQMTAEAANNTLRKLNIAMDIARAYQGKILHHMYSNKLYQELGYNDPNRDNWEDYLKEEFGMAKRTAYDRMKIYSGVIERFNVPVDRVEKIGTSKVIKIVPLLTEDSADYWLDIAENRSYRELELEIKKSRGERTVERDADPEQILTDIRFKVTASQRETIEAALMDAGSKNNAKSPGTLLSYICLQYQTDVFMANEDGFAANKIDWWLTRLEDTFGVKILLDQTGGNGE